MKISIKPFFSFDPCCHQWRARPRAQPRPGYPRKKVNDGPSLQEALPASGGTSTVNSSWEVKQLNFTSSEPHNEKKYESMRKIEQVPSFPGLS